MKQVFVLGSAALVGLVFGASSQSTSGEPPGAGGIRPDPNVVVLNSEKRINLSSPSLTLPVLAQELQKQTGRRFVIGKPYADDTRPYAVLLHETPLNRVLDASAYVTGGRWDRKGNTYTLRVPTEHETTTDSSRYGAALQALAAYLAPVDVNDPGLPPSVSRCIDRFRRAMADPSVVTGSLSLFPEENMRDWSVSTGRRGLGVSWMATTQDGNTQTGKWVHQSWGWVDEKQ